MANALYDTGRAAFGNAGIAWLTDTIKVVLVDTGQYAVNLVAHDFLDDVPAAARIGTPQTLGTKANVGGVLDAADVVFPSVPAGSGTPASNTAAEAIIIYKDTGVEASSQLIAYIDTVASGLPVTPNGGNINITWDNGGNKIFKI